MSYADTVAADQRLVILQAMEQDPDYCHNEYVLMSMLAAVGHSISRDRLATQLAWLDEQGLIGLEEVGALKVARLTGRGEDVVLGRARVPGVARRRLI